jgi:hypothetical protein
MFNIGAGPEKALILLVSRTARPNPGSLILEPIRKMLD